MSKELDALERIKREAETPYFSSLYDIDMWNEDFKTVEKALKNENEQFELLKLIKKNIHFEMTEADGVGRIFVQLANGEKQLIGYVVDEENIARLKEILDGGEELLTLREYIDKNSRGAYHSFIFNVGGATFRVYSIDDFKQYGNENLLDRYCVANDSRNEFGSGCENYHCEHHLTLERVV